MDNDTLTDNALVGRARRGDQEAFGLIYDRHVRPVYWQAYSVLGDATTAEDATQETFVTAWRRLDSIATDDSILPWLLVTAKYVALNHRRSRIRRERRTAQMPDDIAAEIDIAGDVEAAEVRAEIDAAVSKLTETDYLLYELCLIDGLTYAEAATQLGLTHASVRNRLSRLRTRLRTDLRSVTEKTS